MFDCRWYEENWREQNLLPNLYRLNGQHGRFGGGELKIIVKDEFSQPNGLKYGIEVPLAVQEVQHIFVSSIFGSIPYYLRS